MASAKLRKGSKLFDVTSVGSTYDALELIKSPIHRCFWNFQTKSLYIDRFILVALAAEASQRKREGLGRGASGPG